MVPASKIPDIGSSRTSQVFSFGLVICDTSPKLANLVTFSLSVCTCLSLSDLGAAERLA